MEHVASWGALLKRKVVESTGLFDERFFFGWEDFDYCIRAKKVGFKVVYVPKAKLRHKFRSVDKIDGSSQYYNYKGHFRFMKQHATRWQYRLFLIYFFGVHFWLATVYYLMWLRRPKMLLSFYKGIRDGLFHSGDNG